MKLLTTLLLFLTSHLLLGQLFTGTSTDRLKSYNCLLRINKDSTINFIYSRDSNKIYGEFSGDIKKKNDTLFHISAILCLGQYCMKSRQDDTIYIQLDKVVGHKIDRIVLTYANGKFICLKGAGIKDNTQFLFAIPIDKNIFNSTKGFDFFTVTTDKKNSITGEPVIFKIPYGSAAFFTSEHEIKFDIVIKNNIVWTVSDPKLSVLDFTLKKEK